MNNSGYREILYKYVTFLIGFLIIISNTFILVYIRKSKTHKHKPAGFVYIINMALSDLFVGVLMVILKSISPYLWIDNSHLADNAAAKTAYNVIKFCLLRFTLLASVFNLVALTFDRLYAIRFPFAAKRVRRGLHIKICIGIWIVSLVMATVFYLPITYSLNDNYRYKDAIFPIFTIPATVLFIVSYTLIFTVVRRTSNIVRQIEASVRNQQSTSRSIDKEQQHPTERSSEKEKVNLVF